METNDITSMSRSYFTQCVGVILVYQKGDQASFFELRNWVTRAHQDSEWCGSIVLSLWSHDMEGTDSDEVSPELRDSFIDAVKIPKELVFEVNAAEEDGNVRQSYQQVVAAVHEKWTSPPPTEAQPARGNIVLAPTENEGNIQQPSHSPSKKRCLC